MGLSFTVMEIWCLKDNGVTFLLQVTINNVGMFFHVFLYIATHISLDLLSLGSAEADIR